MATEKRPVDELAEKRALHARVNRDVEYYPPSDLARYAHERIRQQTLELAHTYIELCPVGRELSLALTKLIDEAMAHANAAVARNHDRLVLPSEGGT